MSETVPRPSQRGHIPPTTVKVAGFRWSLPSPRSTLMAPVPVAEGTLKE